MCAGHTPHPVVVGGRSKKYMKVAYHQEYLPVLSGVHPRSKLYLLDSHAKDHEGMDSMVMQSRGHLWIMGARRLVQQI